MNDFRIHFRFNELAVDSLPVQKLSGSDSHRSVCRVNQVVDVLTVLVGQGVFAAPASDDQCESHSGQRFQIRPQRVHKSLNSNIQKKHVELQE